MLGFKPKNLKIMPFGISIFFEGYEGQKKLELKKMLIALAGPMVNLIVAIIVLVLPFSNEITQIIIYSNILIASFNLLMIYPLDGGRILKNILEIRNSKIFAEEMSNRISNITVITTTIIGSISILYLKNIAILFIIIYLWGLVISENKKSRIRINTYKTILKFQNDIENKELL